MATRNRTNDATTGSRALEIYRNSTLLKLATFGVGLILLSLMFEFDPLFGLIHDFLGSELASLWAAIFLIWGVAMVFMGIAGRTLIWWGRR